MPAVAGPGFTRTIVVSLSCPTGHYLRSMWADLPCQECTVLLPPAIRDSYRVTSHMRDYLPFPDHCMVTVQLGHVLRAVTELGQLRDTPLPPGHKALLAAAMTKLSQLSQELGTPISPDAKLLPKGHTT